MCAMSGQDQSKYGMVRVQCQRPVVPHVAVWNFKKQTPDPPGIGNLLGKLWQIEIIGGTQGWTGFNGSEWAHLPGLDGASRNAFHIIPLTPPNTALCHPAKGGSCFEHAAIMQLVLRKDAF